MGTPYYTFVPADFRIQYPQFQDTNAYPDSVLTQWFNNATCYIDNVNSGDLNNNCLILALLLMTAHLAAIATLANTGQISGQLQSSTIDKITVTLTPPPNKNDFRWWLSQTPYGQQLLALLDTTSVGGFIAGGAPERAAFRKVGGFY
jgi:hypothetical protein